MPTQSKMAKLTDIMCYETRLSKNSSGLSSNMKIKSKRDNSASLNFKFSFPVLARLRFSFKETVRTNSLIGYMTGIM